MIQFFSRQSFCEFCFISDDSVEIHSEQRYNRCEGSGLLDFTLLKNYEKFYATYKLLEETDYYPYTDKLQIGVVDLTRIDLATPEDQEYNIDKWAKLFKAKTWDIKMVAAKNRMIDAAATTIYQLTEDERIRQQCEAREDYLRRQRGIQKMLEEQRQQLTEKDKQLTEKDQQIAEMQKIIEELRQENKMLRADAE